MDKYVLQVKLILTAIFTFLANSFGGWDTTLSLLVSLIVADIFTGILHAVINKGVSSSEMRKGIVRKLLIFVVIFVAVQIDKVIIELMGKPISIFGMECYIRTLFIIYSCIEEGISLIENLANMGVPFPNWIKDILVQVKDCANSSLPKAIIQFIKDKFGVDISGKHTGDEGTE